jgi:hypothetical protein
MAMDNRQGRLTLSKGAGTTGSWVAVLAATTLGGASAATIRAEVRARGLTDGAYRLVVQSYDRADGPVPSLRERPVGSVQREVTAAELRSGVQVNLLEFRGGPAGPGSEPALEEPVVVAWVEASGAELEFDGRRARPSPGSMYGLVKRTPEQGAVRIRLDRTVRA